MFTARPGLAAEILDGLDVDLAARHNPRPASPVLTEARPVERRADNLLLHGDLDRPAAAVVVEVQLHADAGKRKSWPSYLALGRERHNCPVYLLVVCLDDDVAHWSRAPVDYGHPGLTLVPVVLGPDRTPLVDPDTAPHRPEAAVLAA
nr:hypothetical protein [Micromonospora sp. DSM 115978]